MKTNRITSAGGLLWLALLLLVAATGCARAGTGDPTETPVPTVTPSATPRLDVTLITRPPATVAFTQVTPTPLPTATPTPTPTPIVYQIQEGDTLLALAIDQGTTVEEITALNPGIRPNLLQIGQQIVLPPPATPIFGAGPTAVPINIEVLSVAQYETPVGSVWLMGEVVNNGSLAAENVEVGIGLNAPDGTPLGTAAAWVLPPVLAPGARGTFALLLNEAPSPLGRPTVAVTAGQTMVDLGDRYLEFQLENVEFDAGEESATVSGVIRNGGAAAASGVTVLVTVLDEAGQVSGARQLLLEGVVPAGDTVDFSISVAPPGPPPVDYRVDVYALRAP